MKNFLVAFYLLLFIYSCREERSYQKEHTGVTSVSAFFIDAHDQKVLLERLPRPGGGAPIPLDTFFITKREDTIHFVIRDSVEWVYQLRILNSPFQIFFINDASNIDIRFDYYNDTSWVSGSSHTHSLRNFLSQQASIIQAAVPMSNGSEILQTDPRNKNVQKNLTPAVFNKLQLRCRDYVDSTLSPAAALFIYNAVDFGNQNKKLDSFITRMYNRFPTHPGVKALYDDTQGYLEIFRKDLEAGDSLPALELPDENGKIHSLSEFSGHYLLVDCNASFHPSYVSRTQELNHLSSLFDQNRLKIVRISLDPEDFWLPVIKTENKKWLHLSDGKVWQGKAPYTLLFDSIPYNFLVDPSGIIIGKALSVDSLKLLLQERLK